MRNVILGLVVAAALALIAANASIGGIAAWKIALALVGFLVFAMGRRFGGSSPP